MSCFIGASPDNRRSGSLIVPGRSKSGSPLDSTHEPRLQAIGASPLKGALGGRLGFCSCCACGVYGWELWARAVCVSSVGACVLDVCILDACVPEGVGPVRPLGKQRLSSHHFSVFCVVGVFRGT